MRLPIPRVSLVATAVAVVVATLACAPTTTALPPAVTPAGVRFTLVRPGARTVAVAGSFNRWSASLHPLRRESTNGRWSAVIALDPGEHLFMFVVDGVEWVAPPLAEDYVDDGFGSKNGVVVVRPSSR